MSSLQPAPTTSPQVHPERHHEGAGKFEGIALAPACVITRLDRVPQKTTIPSDEIESEISRLTIAVTTLQERYRQLIPQDQSGLITADNFSSLDFLKSTSTCNNIVSLLREKHWTAQQAVHDYLLKIIISAQTMPDRCHEVNQLRIELIDILEPQESDTASDFIAQVRAMPEDFILVAKGISPQELLRLRGHKIRGFLLGNLGNLPHSEIIIPHLFRGIPLITSVDSSILSSITTGEQIFVDGRTGKFIINPNEQTTSSAHSTIRAFSGVRFPVSLRQHAPRTKDGKPFRFTADIIEFKDAEEVRELDLGGVGLYRCENPIMQLDRWLSATEWHEHFTQLFTAIAPRPVVIRVFDFNGEDKLPPKSDLLRAKQSGLKGIRLALNLFPERLAHLMEGIARASLEVGNKASLLLPMVIDLSEVRETQRLLTTTIRSLHIPGVTSVHPNLIALAAMIETSSAYRLADKIIAATESTNIGTNDSLRSVLDGDRNKATSAFYHPALLMEMRHAIAAARLNGKPLRICGEMPNYPANIPLLVGIGAEDLVLAPYAVAEVNARLSQVTVAECEELVEKIIASGDETIARSLHQEFLVRLSNS